jgi:hypothetical protein
MTTLPKERPCAPSLDLHAFVEREKRPPRLSDAIPPWHYRGWLLTYVIQLHAVIPAVADRWGYHLRTYEAGRLLDEPIPQIIFGPPDNKDLSLFHDWSRLIGWDCGGWSEVALPQSQVLEAPHVIASSTPAQPPSTVVRSSPESTLEWKATSSGRFSAHGSGVQIDAAVECVDLVVESHEEVETARN